MSNYYKDYNFYLYKQYEIFQRENNSYSNNNINNINTNPNSYNLYIGNNLDIINNNSFYFAQVGILNKIHFLQNQNINLKNINDININNNKIDFANINISNINQNCNYYNFLDQSKANNYNKSEFNSILNINKMNNNENENNINGNNLNNYLNYSNGVIINSDNKNNIYDFIQYINSLPIDLVNFLCTPKGVSQVQKKLEESNNIYNLFLVNFLNKQGLSKIMKDTYGNYFFQKLIKKKDKSFISLIVSYISEDFIDISKDYSGTFSLQALLDETSSVEEQQKILNYIKNNEMEMAFNKNATHVLQKIVLLFPDYLRIYLNEVILNNFIDLCLDSNGICLIKIFMKTNTIINNKKRISNIIINNFIILAENPFGNYGIQYLMEIWGKDDLKEIKEKIYENIYKLSLHQFSSNVIEKAIEMFDKENKLEIIKKLCFDKNFILNLLKNKFGKYVLDKAIKYMTFEMKKELEIILLNNINNNIYKSKDKNRIKKLLLKLNISTS